jgi:hypothetical protein
MANWKKVLVSGSAIEGSSLLINGNVTMSATLPTSTDSADLVLVQAAGGQIETRLQSDIQGVTTAVFEITGSDGSNDTFDATGDKLVFSGGDIDVAVSTTTGQTSLKLDTPSGTISGSQQITDLGFITEATDVTGLEASVTALNAVSGSYLVSASVIGTANEVEVTANGAQGIQIGLPNDVTISNNLTVTNDLTADSLTLTGLSLVDNNAAVISGSNIFGDTLTDTHQFTGSIDITGSITADLTQNNTVGVLDLVAVDSNGLFVNAGTAVQSEISGAISNTNAEVDALEVSASAGIHISSSGTGEFGVPLTYTASFAASGNGLSLGLSNNTVTYTITPTDVLSGTGVISGSTQIAELGAGIISSSNQITIGPDNLPSGVISGSITSTAQGVLTLNGNNLDIFGLTAGANPSFGLVTATDLVVTGTTTTVNTTNLNIEDQFILINSGALTPGGTDPDTSDLDGGLIVDFGGGSGSAFFYNADSKAWAVKGTNHASSNQADFLGYATVASNDSDTAIPDYIVSVVSQSAYDPSTNPTYGNSTTYSDLGTMHVNRSTGDIWIYS